MEITLEVMKAILSLRPDSGPWSMSENVVKWENSSVTTPSDSEIIEEMTRLSSIHDSLEYARNREDEYPPFQDYLDGVVKSDQEQIDKYISDCLAVKDKYPKSE